MTMGGNVNGGGHFGDTTLTKVFVGGLAWETPKEAMREHFDKYGDILEAVIISDKLTGRSKGYGFVTFKDPEGAKRACEDASPIINGRRANCNLASLGARRPKQSTTPPPQQGPNNNINIGVGPRSMAPSNQVQWYYPGGTPALPYPPQQQHHQAVPFYGYSPATYITPEINYNHKMSYTRGGAYMNAGQYYPHHHHQVYPSQTTIVGANTMMPMYPVYQYHHSHTMGLPAHMYPAGTTAGPMGSLPALISKPPSLVAPPTARAEWWWR